MVKKTAASEANGLGSTPRRAATLRQEQQIIFKKWIVIENDYKGVDSTIRPIIEMCNPCRALCAIGVMVTRVPSKHTLTVRICYGALRLSTYLSREKWKRIWSALILHQEW